MNEPTPDTHRLKSVVFEFDYVLADTSEGLIACANYALEQMHLPQRTPAEIRGTIGLSITDTCRTLVGEPYVGRAEEFKRIFIERADTAMLPGIRLYETVKPTVEALLARGISLGIVSVKWRYRIEQVMSREGLAGAFSVIIGGENLVPHKPDPTGLKLAISGLGRSPAEVIHVGDGTVDAERARRVGVRFAAVLTGVTARDAFAPWRPYAIIDDLTELPAVVLEGLDVDREWGLDPDGDWGRS